MRYWPTTAAEAAITQLSPPPPAAAASDAADDVPGSSSSSSGADRINDVVSPSGATILIVLLSIAISVFALNAAIRCFLNDGGVDSGRRSWERKKAELVAVVAAVTSTVAYKGGGEDGEAAAECAICLAEFEEGEEIKVLGNCGHGFHGRCIERWLETSRNSSCPTCRRSCLPPTLSPVAVPVAIAGGGGG